MIISIQSQQGGLITLVMVVVLLHVILPPCADAFVTPTPSVMNHKIHSWTASTTLALSSSEGEAPVGEGEDEISKLIGKRNQIKRKKQEEVQSTTAPDPELDNISYNWDSMPELRTKRESRKQKDENSDNSLDEESTKNNRQKEDILAYDFMMDYDDENDFHIPNRIGFSTQGWGDPKAGFVSSGKLTKRMIKAKKFVPGDLQLTYNLLVEGGISLVETSSIYGKASQKDKLTAHDILKTCIKDYDADDTPPIIVESVPSSFLPPRAAAIRKRAEQSCDDLGVDLVDLLQVRKTLPALSRGIPVGLASAMEGGSCSYVGVAGILQKSSLKRFASQVERQGGTLVSNAFEFSLTNLKSEYMIDACKELNVVPLIFNPLDGGLASGVYTATNPSGGEVGSPQRFKFEQLEKLQPLHSVMETVAERVATRVGRDNRDIKDRYRGKGPAPRINTDITTTQVAINYVVAKGGVPIQQVNTPKQAEELLGCLGWTLLENEVDMLDSAASLCTQ